MNTTNYYERGSVLHRAALQRRYFHRGYLLLLRTEPQLFQQGVPGYHGRKPAGVPAALPHGTGGTAADRKPPAHQHHQHHGQLSQSASLFPCVQKCIWHQPTGLSCKAFCTIKIGLILRYTPFVFPTYKNTPFVRPNPVGQMGCCSFFEFWRISFVWYSFWHSKTPHLLDSIPYCLTNRVQFTSSVQLSF